MGVREIAMSPSRRRLRCQPPSRYGSVLMPRFMGHTEPPSEAPSSATVTQPRAKVCVEFQIKQKTKDPRHVVTCYLAHYYIHTPDPHQQCPPRASNNIHKRFPLPGRDRTRVDVSVSIPRIFWTYLGLRIDRYTTVPLCYRPLELRSHSESDSSLSHIYRFARNYYPRDLEALRRI